MSGRDDIPERWRLLPSDRFDAYVATRPVQLALVVWVVSAAFLGGLLAALLGALVLLGVQLPLWIVAIPVLVGAYGGSLAARDAYREHPKGGPLPLLDAPEGQ